MYLRSCCARLSSQTGVVLLEQLQQCFLLDADTEIDVFEFAKGYITVRLHQFLQVVLTHTDFIYRKVDSLCASTLLPEARLFFTSHKRGGTSILQLNCLISAVRDTGH